MDDVRLNGQVVVKKLGRAGGVREDASHFRGGEKYEIGLIRGKEACHGGLIAKIQLRAGGGEQPRAIAALQLPHDCRADQPAMARYVDTAGGSELHTAELRLCLTARSP